MTELTCPSCKTTLARRPTKVGLVWVCPVCRGRAITLQVLRKAVSRTMVNRLWQWARASKSQRKRPCPACRRRMVEVVVAAKPRAECLDVCTACHFVWFDCREFAALPKAPPAPEEKPLSPEAREAIAMARLETVSLAAGIDLPSDEGPDDWWEVVLGCFRVPVEYNDTPLEHRPWATWLTIAAIGLVSLLAFRNLAAAVSGWGLVPAQFTRHWGLTFITSFFLHADPLHLLVNLYFLWIFGDNTEDVLGTGRFLLLLVLASLCGDVLHLISEPGSTVPAIGASGGISGVLAYYALRFPRADIGLLIWYRWVRLPAWAMFALWVLAQAHGAYFGSDGVAVFAHLGGAAVGVAFWCLTQRSLAKAPPASLPSPAGWETIRDAHATEHSGCPGEQKRVKSVKDS